MFSFLKSSERLFELLPDNYVDIHSHLLYGIDDGAQTAEDTLKIIKKLQNNYRFSEFITTPHVYKTMWDNSKDDILAKEKQTKKVLEQSGLTMPFKAAAEYMLDNHLMHLLATEKLLTLKDNYVLVELSFIDAPMQLFDIVFELKLQGYVPVLAHPERYMYYHSDIAKYKKLKKQGCLFQLNLLSTTGYYGEHVAKMAATLLKLGMINFVGSDIHTYKQTEYLGFSPDIKDTAPLKEAAYCNLLFQSTII